MLAAMHGHHRVLSLLLQHGARVGDSNPNHPNRAKTQVAANALSLAIEHSRAECARLLLKSTDSRKKKQFILSALFAASCSKTAYSLSLLIAHGIDVNARGRARQTALHIAAAFANPTVITKLIEAGSDLDARDFEAATPLHWAADAGKVQNAKCLLKRGANPDLQDKYKRTPFDDAKLRGSKPMMKLLLQQ